MYEGTRVDLSGHISRWIGDLDLGQYRWIVCVGHDEAEEVRSALSADSASVMVANEHQGGIPDPYELGMAGYRDCLALLDQVVPHVRGASEKPKQSFKLRLHQKFKLRHYLQVV